MTTTSHPWLAEQLGAADQAEVGIGLRVVTQGVLGHRVVLLGEQAGGPGDIDELLEELLGLGAPSAGEVGLDHPRRTQVEAALAAREAVVVLVAVNGGAAALRR